MKKTGEFKLHAPFPPAGDQPQAIDKLCEGARDGLAHQVLLGATGTGKSVAWYEPVTVELSKGEFYRGAIGALLDKAFGSAQESESDEMPPPAAWRVLAWDNTTGNVAWRRITALSRHASPSTLFRLRTNCGREVTVTGDHSVWVLRQGRLQLLRGNEVRQGDAMPVPLQLPEPVQPLTSLNWLSILGEASRQTVVLEPEKMMSLGKEDIRSWKDVLRPFYPCVHDKWSHVRNQREGFHVAAAQALCEHQMVSVRELSLASPQRRWPAVLSLTSDVGFIWGQYLAEGHAAERCALFSVRETQVQNELQRCFDALNVPYFRRVDGDFVVSSKSWSQMLRNLMGSGAARKQMPAQWVSLSNDVLSSLLRGYFEGDGGVDGSAVTAVTSSTRLAADVTEALLRFGIWARMREVGKRKSNGEIGTYHKITISGAENLQRFQTRIGFASDRKNDALHDATRSSNTNVDVVTGVGAHLCEERLKQGILQREIAQKCGCSRSAIGAIENGKRQPSRALFQRLCHVLKIEDAAFCGLSKVHWSPLESIAEVAPKTPCVYDFSVDGYETFLTGSGGLFVHNTYTASQVIARLQRPALIIAHNKTLAAQLCQEIREFFPKNAVEYFVSYYDYYQPEAYMPHTDTYIEKESSRNEEIDRLRHASTQSVSSRRDVIIVSSVSCIYGLGTPDLYQENVLELAVGQTIDRRGILEKLVMMQFARNDINLIRGTFRVRGDVLEIHPRDAELVTRIDTFGDEIESIQQINTLTGEVVKEIERATIFPATHFIASEDRMAGALVQIEADLNEQVAYFESVGKLLEAQRLKQRVRYDLEMMREVGYCNGIENYSRYLDGRVPGAPPFTLLDYFPKDYLLVVDESHQTMPQIRGMYNGDRARKEVLIDYGFRLPAAFDNRPLKFEEFEERRGQTIYVSATPGPYEMEHIGYRQEITEVEIEPEAATEVVEPKKNGRKAAKKKVATTRQWIPEDVTGQIVEQIIRPTGLIDPEISIRPTRGQIDDLLGEIRERTARKQRVLVTTLTKRMAEDLTDYLKEINVKVNYLHSDVVTLERSQILRELRQGKYDVIVGINLLREGLDLPEVSLVAILDADKEGFLRSDTSLIQTIGRAARHVEGQVIMYADRITGSMQRAIDETNRRRAIQLDFNERNGITPQGIQKAIRNDLISEMMADARAELKPSSVMKGKPKPEELPAMLEELETEMKAAAAALDFERAAQLRDELLTLRELVNS